MILPVKKEITMMNRRISRFTTGKSAAVNSGKAVRSIIDGYQGEKQNLENGGFDQDRSSLKVTCEKRWELILGGLSEALRNKELEIYYQPIVSLWSNQPVCLEALVRWNHPEWGLIFPCDFIPFAEEAGLIKDIGSWVIKNSCRQLNKWQAEYPGYQKLAVSVNVSPKQLEDLDLVKVVMQTLKKNDIHEGSLILEITESSIIHDTKLAAKIINALKSIGVKIFLDDFGVGYSYLNGLGNFLFDSIKLDRKFVWKMLKNKQDLAALRGIFEQGLKLNTEIVAEGIETEDQRDLLKEMHCKLGQGFFYSKPLRTVAVEQMLAGTVC
jgi:EAL domain-containing protein (putative c-di-GMP-specific phosphodiesterase class I)